MVEHRSTVKREEFWRERENVMLEMFFLSRSILMERLIFASTYLGLPFQYENQSIASSHSEIACLNASSVKDGGRRRTRTLLRASCDMLTQFIRFKIDCWTVEVRQKRSSIFFIFIFENINFVLFANSHVGITHMHAL